MRYCPGCHAERPETGPGFCSSACELDWKRKHRTIAEQVRDDLTERERVGIETYGGPLYPNNGRDALQDAYEEALDLACYLKQAMIERGRCLTHGNTTVR